MRAAKPQKDEIRHEPMRIAGKKADADDVVEVRYPYTDGVIGTVPAGGAGRGSACEGSLRDRRQLPVQAQPVRPAAGTFESCGAAC